MTYSEIQLEIIKRFGRKELTEGCLIQQGEYHMNIWCIYEGIYNMKEINSANCMQVQKSDIGEILGHIPQWNDLFSALIDKGLESFLGSESLLIDPDEKNGNKKNIAVNKYIPLIEQPESVLIELLNLFK